MDIGRSLILIAIAVYYIFQYKKNKKGFNLFMIVIVVFGLIYKMPFNLYNNLSNSIKKIIDISFIIIVLCVIALYERHKTKSCK